MKNAIVEITGIYLDFLSNWIWLRFLKRVGGKGKIPRLFLVQHSQICVSRKKSKTKGGKKERRLKPQKSGFFKKNLKKNCCSSSTFVMLRIKSLLTFYVHDFFVHVMTKFLMHFWKNMGNHFQNGFLSIQALKIRHFLTSFAP